MLAGQVGIAGSTQHRQPASPSPARSGVVGHLEIGDGAIVTAQIGHTRDVAPGTVLSGSPGLDNRAWLKSTAVFAKLPELQRRVRELERALEELKPRG